MAEFGFVSVVPGCASARHDWKNTNNTRPKTWQEQEQEREEFNKRQQEQAAKERAQAEAKAKAEAEAKAKQGEGAGQIFQGYVPTLLTQRSIQKGQDHFWLQIQLFAKGIKDNGSALSEFQVTQPAETAITSGPDPSDQNSE